MAKQLQSGRRWGASESAEIKPLICGAPGSVAEARYRINELLIEKVFKGGKQWRMAADALRHLNGLRQQPFNEATIDTLIALGRVYADAHISRALYRDEKAYPRIATDTRKLIVEISCRAAAGVAANAPPNAVMVLAEALQQGEKILRAVEDWQQQPTTRYASIKPRSSGSYRPLSCLPF